MLMSVLDCLTIPLWDTFAFMRVFYEEGIVHISGWVTLRLEQGIEVPERALNISVSWHFIESHLQEDLSEVGPYFQKRM